MAVEQVLLSYAPWIIAILAGAALLGRKRKKKKRKKSKYRIAVILGVLLIMAGGSGTAVTVVDSGSGYRALGERLASSYGWGSGPQWTCLDELWTRESGWRMVWNAQGSDAFGIPQALPASKMASAGADYMTNPRTQIRWGLQYLYDTYGSPCAGWDHELAYGWY